MIKTIVLSLVLGFSFSAQAKNIFTKRNSFEAQLGLVFPQAEPTAGKLLYYGGAVIAEPKVEVVFWNKDINPAVKANMSDFYSTYLNSQHMDWLSEYSTTGLTAVDGRQGTNQVIKRGSVIGEVVLTPSIVVKSIKDSDIQAEIVKQIDNGSLPRPDENTLYMIHFPKNVRISLDGSTSCLAFGGYHFAFTDANYGNIYYGVMPECGGFGGVTLDSITEVSAHELNEAVTDAVPTPGSSPAYPQAWNDNGGNEIGDICQNQAGTTMVGAKRNYAIVLEWSNSRNRCYDGKSN
jgi:hypothetical protein